MRLPPLTLANPDHWSFAGIFFWIVVSQMVSYSLRVLATSS